MSINFFISIYAYGIDISITFIELRFIIIHTKSRVSRRGVSQSDGLRGVVNFRCEGGDLHGLINVYGTVARESAQHRGRGGLGAGMSGHMATRCVDRARALHRAGRLAGHSGPALARCWYNAGALNGCCGFSLGARALRARGPPLRG